MATRSRIGIENPDGTVTSIYCHFDGYPNGVGKTLYIHYVDRSKVEDLISVGNISYLEAEVMPPANKKHSFNEPLPGYTVAYHRDRGEEFSQRLHPSTSEFLQIPKAVGARVDFVYLYTQSGEWYVSKNIQSISIDARKVTIQLLENAIN